PRTSGVPIPPASPLSGWLRVQKRWEVPPIWAGFHSRPKKVRSTGSEYNWIVSSFYYLGGLPPISIKFKKNRGKSFGAHAHPITAPLGLDTDQGPPIVGLHQARSRGGPQVFEQLPVPHM